MWKKKHVTMENHDQVQSQAAQPITQQWYMGGMWLHDKLEQV